MEFSFTATFSPFFWASTPASQHAAVAYPSQAVGPPISPRTAASTQDWISTSYAAPKRSSKPGVTMPPQRPALRVYGPLSPPMLTTPSSKDAWVPTS